MILRMTNYISDFHFRQTFIRGTQILTHILYDVTYTEKNFRRLIYPENPLITEKPVYLRNQPRYKPFS